MFTFISVKISSKNILNDIWQYSTSMVKKLKYMIKLFFVYLKYLAIFLIVAGCTDEGIKISDAITILNEQVVPRDYLSSKIAAEILKTDEIEIISSFDKKAVDYQQVELAASELSGSNIIDKKLIQIIDSPKVFLSLEKPAKNHHYLSEELIGYGENGKWNYVIHRKQGSGLSQSDAIFNVTTERFYAPFDKDLSYSYEGVFYQEDKIIVRKINNYNSYYLYISPEDGSKIHQTPETNYHFYGDYFNKDRSVLYYPRMEQNKVTNVKSVLIEQYKISGGIWENVFEFPAIGGMNRQGYKIDELLSFNNDRYLALSISNSGRGVGFGGLVVLDLESKNIIYQEYFDDYTVYKIYATDLKKLIFTRQNQKETKMISFVIK